MHPTFRRSCSPSRLTHVCQVDSRPDNKHRPGHSGASNSNTCKLDVSIQSSLYTPVHLVLWNIPMKTWMVLIILKQLFFHSISVTLYTPNVLLIIIHYTSHHSKLHGEDNLNISSPIIDLHYMLSFMRKKVQDMMRTIVELTRL